MMMIVFIGIIIINIILIITIIIISRTCRHVFQTLRLLRLSGLSIRTCLNHGVIYVKARLQSTLDAS